MTLVHTAAGGEYGGVTASLSVTVVDNDRAIVLAPSSLTWSEDDTTGETYTVKLATQPSSDNGDRDHLRPVGHGPPVDKASLTFTTVELEHRAGGEGDGG